MIEKSRLQELIEQGATIYSNFGGISKIYLDYIDTYIKDDRLYEKDRRYGNLFVGNLENLFETKEEAEWELEFGNITRTETLRLPAFELLPKELDIPFIRYNEELESFVLYELYTYNNEISVYFRVIYDDFSDCLLRKPLTKENYTEACRLAKKLFLGEVEE